MTLTLVRHAQVEEKYLGCYNGHLNIGLSTKGYADAKDLGKHFKASNFDDIYCSDLLRAKETLKAFISTDAITYTKELREKSWGKHEGLSFDEICTKDSLKYENFIQFIDALDGQSIEDFKARVEKFFFTTLASTQSKNILVMTHSGVIKTFISIVKNISLEEAFSYSIPYSSFVVYNSETNKLTMKKK
ncbi:histidine phosphatase family protein [Sulfurimonas sp.]|uniref:histidine phosphatase family protein n=1 Tax=Sulfurimonas sp. TaxID=2022749 RepID=UPI002AB0EA0C|nr:histidine phosphatase family protein [Sulfurimonas sp.]